MRAVVRGPLSLDPPVGSISLDTNTKFPTHQREAEAVFLRRTGRKLKSHNTFRRLLNLKESPNRKQYLRGFGCSSVWFQDVDASMTSNYCGSRACVTCSGIRSGHLRDTYLPHVKRWGAEAHFVTLTDKNCHVNDLRLTHQERGRLFERVFRRVKRQYPNAKAIKTTEIACKHKRPDTIHHHLHLIVNTYAVAVAIREAWIALCPDCSSGAQHIREGDSKSLLELVKYAIKGLADERPARRLPTVLLDAILVATKGLKLATTHGFSPSDTYDEDAAFESLKPQIKAWKRIGEVVVWAYCPEVGEYMDYSTGELLLSRGFSFGLSGFA